MQNCANAGDSALTVLIADDDPIFRHLAESRLVRNGCKLLLAQDGGEAWRLTREHQLDLAIVDFEMPGLDGTALIQCLRSHPATRHIPIVLCTSREDAAAAQAAGDAGASSFLRKPINWSLFERHIEHLLSLGRLALEARRAREEIREINAAKDAEIAALLSDLDAMTRAREVAGAREADIIASVRCRLDRFAETYEAFAGTQAPASMKIEKTNLARTA